MKEFLRIKETCLYIKDLYKARRFYEGILEMEVIHFLEGQHLFLRAGQSVLLCFNPNISSKKTSPPAHFAHGNQHFAFEVLQTDYENCKRRIIELGISITDEVIWKSGQESFYFNDPEDNVLEVVPSGIWE